MGVNLMSIDRISASSRGQHILIAGVCLLSAVRVFVFCAAFPFFNNVDEASHFDLVFKYSRGHLPAAQLEKFDPEAAKIIASNGTGEYFGDQIDLSPEWIADSSAFLGNEYNRETWAWPTYYIMAGLWCWFGKILGLTSGQLLYWVRFLNVPIVVAFVWLSYLFSRRFFNENSGLRFALPLIVAFFPQDIFFGITADVLSPLVFAATFFMLLEIHLKEKSPLYYMFAGLLVAAAFLTKVSNIAIVPLAAVVVFVKLKQAFSQKLLRQYLPSLVVFAAASTVPVVLWLGRNYVLFGDLVGAAGAMKLRTWTIKPFSEMFNHPILTPRGLGFFLTELTASFWRGEFVWGDQRMISPLTDWFYVILSAVLLAASVLGLVFCKTEKQSPYRVALKAALFVFVFSVLFLAVISMRYDFGTCVYPSRESPYFTSGRLIAGAILPFLFLYIDGLRRILSKLHLAGGLIIIVGVIAVIITISEIVITWPVFSSPLNFFHFK